MCIKNVKTTNLKNQAEIIKTNGRKIGKMHIKYKENKIKQINKK